MPLFWISVSAAETTGKYPSSSYGNGQLMLTSGFGLFPTSKSLVFRIRSFLTPWFTPYSAQGLHPAKHSGITPGRWGRMLRIEARPCPIPLPAVLGSRNEYFPAGRYTRAFSLGEAWALCRADIPESLFFLSSSALPFFSNSKLKLVVCFFFSKTTTTKKLKNDQ